MTRSIIAGIPDEALVDKIYFIRGQKVMMDRDLAQLYGVETKVLKQAVKRNITRFPKDFMFVLTAAELKIWRSQFVTSKSDLKGLRYSPFCFTEPGVTMLSCILNSPRAIEVNIRIIRIFTHLRETLMTHKDILLKLEQLENKVSQNTMDVKQIFVVLRGLVQERVKPRRKIGYPVKTRK
jgi:hypothetical protein